MLRRAAGRDVARVRDGSEENEMLAVVDRESDVDEELAVAREDERSRTAQGGVEPTKAVELKVRGTGSWS